MKKTNTIQTAQTTELTLYNVREIAQILKISKDYVYELVYSGALPAMRLTTIKITHKALTEFLERCTGLDLSNPQNIHAFGCAS